MPLKMHSPHVIPQIVMMLHVDSYPILQWSCLHCQDRLLHTCQIWFREAAILQKYRYSAPNPLQLAQHCSGLRRHSQSMANMLSIKVQRLLPLLTDWGSRQLLTSSASHFFQYSPFVFTSPTSVLIHFWCAIGKAIISLPNLGWS